MSTCLTGSAQRVTPSVPQAGLTLSVVTDAASLEQLQPAWSDLLQRSSANEPMLSPFWLLPWWRLYGEGTGRQLRVVLFRDGDRLIGLAPLLWRRCWYRPGIPFRRLEPLGAKVDESDGVWSDYLNLIVERGAEGRVAQALAGAVSSGALGRVDEVVLPALDGDGPLPPLLVEAFGQAGLSAECVATGGSPYIALPATWEDYLKALGKKKRYLVRTLRDFDDWAGPDARFVCATTPAELEEGKRILRALNTERWQDAGQKGIFEAARFIAFHDAVLPRLLAEGALQLLWLSVRGEPIAALYNIVWQNKVYFFQAGRKMDVPRAIRPGIVAHAHAIRSAIAAGLREYDFLEGVTQYKQQLALATRPLLQVRAVRPGLREQGRRLASFGIAHVKKARAAGRAALDWLRRRPAVPGELAGAEGEGANRS